MYNKDKLILYKSVLVNIHIIKSLGLKIIQVLEFLKKLTETSYFYDNNNLSFKIINLIIKLFT